IDKSDEELLSGEIPLTTKEDLEKYHEEDRHVFETGEPLLNFEETQIRQDKKTYWLRSSKLPLRNIQGDIIGVLGMYEDITDHRQLEQDLQLIGFCVDHASIGIVRTGSDARIQRANRHFCQMLGYTDEELCTMHVYDLDPNFPLERW